MTTIQMETLPFHQKELLPKDKVDRGLFVFLAVIIPLVLFWELVIVLPFYHQSFSFITVVHVLAGLFIVFNIVGNLYMVKRIDASGKHMNLPAALPQQWVYCYKCQLNSPPRSYHCDLCNECILKRDHHCKFTGCCVGYYNHRYFIVGLLYIWIGTVYASVFEWTFCFENIGGYNVTSLLSLIAPHLALLLGYFNFFKFLVATIHVITVVGTGVTTFILYQQLLAIVCGQTQYERNKNIRTYDIGWKRNLKEVFGNSWYLVLLFPLLKSPLSGDGLKFKTSFEIEEIKNI